MRIIVTSIEAGPQVRLGTTQLPAFPAHFKSEGFAGSAWFVPASGQGADYIGQTLDVEISQEAVSQFALEDDREDEVGVEPASTSRTYKVVGLVTSIVPLEEPPGEAIFTVSIGDAEFTLARSELGHVLPAKGSKVSFIAHDLSLWDEAI
jgi:hypothetical protein